MSQRSLIHSTLVVDDYDEAIEFFVDKLGFSLIEDRHIPEQDKRWVLVSPQGNLQHQNSNSALVRYSDSSILLARASNDNQKQSVGMQTGGRVAFFLKTDDFWRDYKAFKAKQVEFVREVHEYDYGTVAVFKDLYGNLWDLIEYR